MAIVHEVWDLQGTEQENQIVKDTLDRMDFPWEWLKPELRSEVNKTAIPVEWEDLSRYTQELNEDLDAAESHDDHSEHDHSHEPKMHSSPAHRAHGSDEEYHIIGYRNAVLGLAWYSGKVTIEKSLVSNPELAGEVFISEGAHMVDFFYMTDEHRVGVWNAFHPDEEPLPLDTDISDGTEVGHGHSWFDVGDYYSWVGEAFMGGFIKAFSDLPVTIDFDHPATDEVGKEIRKVFGLEREEDKPAPEPEPEPEPTPPEEPEEPGADEPVSPPEDAPFSVWESLRYFMTHMVELIKNMFTKTTRKR